MSKSFEILHKYLQKQMRMSHIYQPVMIRRLLLDGGVSNDRSIAEDLSAKDPSQVDYYINRVNQMVGKVLRKNGIVKKENENYFLQLFEGLTHDEKTFLINSCETKIDEFIKKRNVDIWEHRNRTRKPISGDIIHQVLERAKGRCELCGIKKEIKHLEVDHIVPKSLGGPDNITNFQALCYSCNSRKGNRYSMDYRKMGMVFEKREDYCIFCDSSTNSVVSNRVMLKNELAYCVEDGFPVTEGHSLIIPRRHFANYFDINQAEVNACQELLISRRKQLLKTDSKIEGFNIGINQGSSAGQTINHCHIHLIPRRIGDVENPRGGIRHTIPGKGFY